MNPYLSFVVAARNDNYGGDFMHRMQVFLNAWLYLGDKYGLDAELVIVEWNPPEDRPPLREALRWPDGLAPGRIRIVQVPTEIHERIPNAKNMPVFEYIAKNVGIRRACGDYILASNPDILFSERLTRYLAAKKLREGCFYVADRYDTATPIPLDLSVEQQLRLCAESAFRFHRLGSTVPARWLPRLRQYLAGKRYLLSPRWVAGESLRRVRVTLRNEREPLRFRAGWFGDFLLMSAKDWHALRGFPEIPAHSHIDAYMVNLAAIAGLRQVIVPDRIYHQEHDRSEQSQRPLTDFYGNPTLQRMLETRRAEITNGENWGLWDTDLRSVPLRMIPASEQGSRVAG